MEPRRGAVRQDAERRSRLCDVIDPSFRMVKIGTDGRGWSLSFRRRAFVAEIRKEAIDSFSKARQERALPHASVAPFVVDHRRGGEQPARIKVNRA